MDVIKVESALGKIEDAVVVDICVREGDQVKIGDKIAEIEADKAVMEVHADCEGVVKAVIAQPGDRLFEGFVLILLGKNDKEIDKNYIISLKNKQKRTDFEQKIQRPSMSDLSKLPARTADLSQVKLGDKIPLSRLQKLTGDKMVQSKREIPCFYLTTVVDMTDLFEFRSEQNEKSETKISFNDYILKAMAIGIEKFPVMGAKLGKDEIILDDSIDIALAVAAGNDLFAPVAKAVNSKSVSEIAGETKSLAEQAREFELAGDNLEGGCCCLTNLGSFGVESFIPIVIPGQCFILGAGEITDSLVVSGKDIETRKQMSITISVDHRIANGAYAAQFLDFVKKTLENPQSLV